MNEKIKKKKKKIIIETGDELKPKKKKKKKKIIIETGDELKPKKKKKKKKEKETEIRKEKEEIQTKKISKEDFLKMLNKNKKQIKTEASKKIVETGEIFIPEIKDDDNILVRMVKTMLIENPISLKELNWRNDSDMYNYKNSLRNYRTMSIEKFDRWLELLGKTFEIVIKDL